MIDEQKEQRERRRAIGRHEVLCPHCEARNPSSAYCCLNCFQPIHGKALPFWRRPLSSGRLSVTAMVVIGFFLITGVVKWLQEAESHLAAMNEANQIYQQSTLEHRRLRAANSVSADRAVTDEEPAPERLDPR